MWSGRRIKDAGKELTGGRGVDIVVGPVRRRPFTTRYAPLARAAGCWSSASPVADIPTSRSPVLLNNVDAVGVAGSLSLITRISGRAVGGAGAAAASARCRRRSDRLTPRARCRRDRIAGGPNGTGKVDRQDCDERMRRPRDDATSIHGSCRLSWLTVATRLFLCASAVVLRPYNKTNRRHGSVRHAAFN